MNRIALMLAGMLSASAGWAQSEQWLDYHHTAEARSYQSVKLETNAPANVALPKFKAKPYFLRWKTPMDPSGGRWACFDRTRSSGPYDLLYIDANGDGKLDNKTAIKAEMDDNFSYFKDVPVVFKGEDGPITYHLIFRFYQYSTNAPQMLLSSAGWYEGTVNFDGVKKRVQLFDATVNGAFNDMDADPYKCDRVHIDGDKTEQRFLGQMLEVGGKFFRVEVARDGAFIKAQKAEQVAMGTINVPTNISEFVAYGQPGHYVRKPEAGALTLPEGKYRMVSWKIERKDEKNSPWTLTGRSFPSTATFEVAAGKSAEVDIGEPIKAVLTANEQGNRQISFDLKFEGKLKETVGIDNNNNNPRAPKLILANATGTQSFTNSFEFG